MSVITFRTGKCKMLGQLCSLLLLLLPVLTLSHSHSHPQGPQPPRRERPIPGPLRISRGAHPPLQQLPLRRPFNFNAHHYRRNKPSLPQGDLHAAAQTLYDLRGFNIPLAGQKETQRFLRQNDPFSFSRFSQPLQNRNLDSRTAPLVFPSFYQNQNQQDQGTTKRPGPVLNIFGHSQHLSQTKYEPAGSSNGLGNGNLNSNNVNLQGQSQTFRPSQIDIGLGGFQNFLPQPQAQTRAPQQQQQQHHNNQQNNNHHQQQPNNYKPFQFPQFQALPEPQGLQGRQVNTQQQQQQILNYRAPQLNANNGNNGNNNQNANANNGNENANGDEPFIYVYDDEDYEEGDEEYDDKPQQQINSNRVTTPTPNNKATSPRSQVIFPQQHQSHHGNNIVPSAKPLIHHSTTTPIPIQNHQNQQNFFNQQNQQNQQQQPGRDNFNNFFAHHQSQRQDPFNGFQFPRYQPTITPTPNVEINPSSERKPPSDQSNAIQSTLKPIQRVVNDDRFRRPAQAAPNNSPQFHQERQTGSKALSNQGLEESEEEIFQHDPEIIQKLTGPSPGSYQYEEPRPETKLRPVNTLVPKNRVPQEDIVLPPNFPFHEDIQLNRPQVQQQQQNQQGGRGDILRPILRPQYPTETSQQSPSPSPSPPPSQQQHRLRPTSSFPNVTPSPFPSTSRTRIPTRTTSTTTQSEIETEAPKRPQRTRVRQNNIHRQTYPNTVSSGVSVTSTRRPFTSSTTAAPIRTTPFPRTTTTSSTTESYEELSDEYYEDDYDPEDPNSIEEEEIAPVVLKPVKPVTTIKSPLRPDFSNNRNQNQIQIHELTSLKEAELQAGRRRPSTTTAFTPTSRRTPSGNGHGKKLTTGKPLYYAGKMLAREGGLYAGQKISPYHVYGQPVPNVPINSVFDRMPSILDGNVRQGQGQTTRVRAQPQVVTPALVGAERGQGHGQQRGRGRDRDGTTPASRVASSTVANPHSRLIHPSRIRTHVQATQPSTSTEREPVETPAQISRVRPSTKKYVRPTPTPEPEEEEEVAPPPPPRRRKVRPGQGKKARQQFPQKQEQQQSSVSISHSVRETETEEENEDEQDTPVPPRKNLRPNLQRPRLQSQTQSQKELQPIVQVIQSHSVSSSSTESSSTEPSVPLRPRGRPRLQGNQGRKVPVLQSPKEEEEEEDNQEEIASPPPVKRPQQKRVQPRPRLQKQGNNKISFPTKEIAQSTQTSVKVGRKPTEAPNRFSSKFRDDPPPKVFTSTRPSVSSSENEDEDDDNNGETGLKHFSPPPKSKPRPSFKPPVKPVRPQGPQQPQQKIAKKPRLQPKPVPLPPQQTSSKAEGGDPDDLLPPSIRLSAKDVVINRKPARRIPPGSASDRLKALQERRKKISTAQEFRENLGQDENSNTNDEVRGQRTLRRRKLLHPNPSPTPVPANEDEEEVSNIPPRVVPNRPAGARRRVIKRIRPQQQQQRKKIQQQEEEQEDVEANDEETRNLQDDEDFREIQQNKREIANRNLKNRVVQVQVPYSQEEEEENEREISLPPSVRKAIGRVPSEVSSDEARSVVGIVRPQQNIRKPSRKPLNDEGENYEDDYEAHHSHISEKKVSTEVPPSSTTVRISSSSTTEDVPSDDEEEEEEITEDYSPAPAVRRKFSSTSTESPVATETSTATNLKSRLRPNKKLLDSLKPKLTPGQQREKVEANRSNNLSRLMKFRTSSSTNSPVSTNSQIFKMATEDPSLPLEDMFSNVNRKSK